MKEINIAEILRNKQIGIKLYSPIFGECTFSFVQDGTNNIFVKNSNKNHVPFNSKGLYYDDGECVVFPSKEMRDWSKFAWKKGDVLISNDGKKEVFFNGFTDDTYTLFKAKHGFEVLSDGNTMYLADEDGIATSDYTLEDKDAAQTYINTIEEKLGGKLNRETLEVEKQPEFKDGDIVTMHKKNCDIVLIFNRLRTEGSFYYYAFHALQTNNTGVIDCHTTLPCAWTFFEGKMNFATDSEKQQLFDALAKEGKRWNSKKKRIVDLKPKVEFKPFDKVLIRNYYNEVWKCDFYSFGIGAVHSCIVNGNCKQCIPYNEETAKLIGTTKDIKG